MQITQTLLLAAYAVSTLAFPLEESTSLKSSRDALNILEGRASTYAVGCKGGREPNNSRGFAQLWRHSIASDSDHKEYTQKEVKSAYDSGREKVKAEDCTVTDQSQLAPGRERDQIVPLTPWQTGRSSRTGRVTRKS